MPDFDLMGASWIEFPYLKQEGMEMKSRNNIEGCFFKTQFYIEAHTKLVLSLSANSRYKLWVNGRPILAGPCKGDRCRHFYETMDVTSFLVNGWNVITARILSYPDAADFSDITGPYGVISSGSNPCFILKGMCQDEEGDILHNITTGMGSWFACTDETTVWTGNHEVKYAGSTEVVYGQRVPPKLYEYDPALQEQASSWVIPAIKWKVEESIYGELPSYRLSPRPIPLLYEKERSFVREMPLREDETFPISCIGDGKGSQGVPAYIPPDSRAVLELDAGELVTGYMNLRVSGGRGSRVAMIYAEAYAAELPDGGSGVLVKSIRDDSENLKIIGYGDTYYPSGGEDIYEPFWFRAFRFVRLEVETGEEGLWLFPPVYRETGYPLEVFSSIQCPEPWVENLWEMSIRTLSRCMHETYEDCPYYEQLQYILDTRLQALFTYMVSGDTRLAAKAIEDFHASRLPEGMLQSRYPCQRTQVIPAFALYWILMVHDYYWQTGDVELVKKYQATQDGILQWFHQKKGQQGLIEKLGYWEFFDWAKEWSATVGVPTAVQYGPSTNHNLLYAYTLGIAAELCQVAERQDAAEEYRRRAEDILSAVECQCFSAEEGLFREGPEFYEFSQHAQVFAVLNGLVKGEQAAAMLQKTLAGRTRQGQVIAKCSFPMQFLLFRALETAGLYDETRSLWDMWIGLLNMNLTTIPETPENPRSDCHAWGALALYEFTRNFMGVNPGSPGWNEIVIHPKALWMQAMSGSVITPKGMAEVQWQVKEGVFHLQVMTPPNIQATYFLPDGSKFSSLGGRFEATCRMPEPQEYSDAAGQLMIS